jgi:hypothetical protein
VEENPKDQTRHTVPSAITDTLTSRPIIDTSVPMVLHILSNLVNLQGHEQLNGANYKCSTCSTEYGFPLGPVYPRPQLHYRGLLPHVPGATILLEDDVPTRTLPDPYLRWEPSWKFPNSRRYSFSQRFQKLSASFYVLVRLREIFPNLWFCSRG